MARRESYHLEGISHRAPIPNGAKVGNILYSSAIGATDPATGEPPEGIEEQAEAMFQNVKRLVEQAGGSTEDIVHVRLLLKDRSLRDQIDKVWLRMFPDEHNRPARHASQIDLGGATNMQCEIVAVIG
jgi:2-iminobutanoate/2-iminopropanoate deaminase